jgi:LytS/YehU family sensor histidine kinase
MRLKISETERRLLKAQVKPHFTYNILNSIQSMILKEETDKAYEFMGEFAALMRKDLEAYDQNFISLSEELKLLESYLKLEKLRFQENDWNYEILLDENIVSEQIQVPPMFLQPFVENTIKHGFSTLNYPGRITIKGYTDREHLYFEVTDNGQGLKENNTQPYYSKGIGIVRKRLQLINDLNSVIIDNREDTKGVKVSIQMAL